MEITTHTHTHNHTQQNTHAHYFIVPLIDIIWTISIYHCFPLHCCVLIRTLVCRSYLLSAKVKEKMSSCSMYQYATFFRIFSFYGSVLLLRMFLYGFFLRFFFTDLLQRMFMFSYRLLSLRLADVVYFDIFL